MMKTTNSVLYVAMMAAFASHSMTVYADDEPSTKLDTLVVTVKGDRTQTNLLGRRTNVSDMMIRAKELKQRPTTLGDALDGELGIHSNQFGGGASAPIIRGQEGKRITILQNNADVIDMAHLSPDHAVMVDTVLAKQAEVVRGVSTLLYKSGNSAGAVNIIDNKIPTQMPDKPIVGEVGVRFNTGNHEKLGTGAVTFSAGSHVAVHLEGLHKSAGDYRTPNYTYTTFDNENQIDRYVKAPERLAALEKEWQAIQSGTPLSWRDKTYFISDEAGYLKQKAILDQDLSTIQNHAFNHLPESWANSKSGSVGVSWIGSQGHLGVAVSERKDKYGLPAHNAIYEGCGVISIFDSLWDRPYLATYPQLINEDDVNYINPRPDCADHAVDNFNHSHGVHKKHDKHGKPYVDLTTRRYDLRGEWNKPTSFVDKVRANVGYVDYKHDEKEGDVVNTSFMNKGKVARIELTHTPTNQLKALWGMQYTKQDNSALSPQTEWRKRQLLTQNKLTNTALFAMGQYHAGNVELELGTRLEKQKVAMDYDTNHIIETMKERSRLRLDPDKLQQAIDYAIDATKPYQNTAHSYALGVHWKFLPQYTLSFNASRQERLPNSQELYTHGMHLATNSFEIGNRHLTKEKSNNYELGLRFAGDKLDYKLAGYVYDFDNYIYLSTINEYLGTARVNHLKKLRINRYDQSPARFYGLEASAGYQFNDTYYASIFGDYIRGKLHDMPPIISDYTAASWGRPAVKTYTAQEDRTTPRLPPMRLGMKVKADFDDRWSGNFEYVRTFDQNKVSKFEAPTKGHHLLNVGVNYQNHQGNLDYSMFFNANNLLNQKIYAHETFLSYIPQMGRNFNVGVSVKF
ncbi:TonB-dependent receptor [Moraxella sp. Tifton1]|uniref:TonB-dependent receptor n=1 Tax=Moraxella oculi TaxID=2940516 RepID=A0ABW8U6Y0_9GAMM|nr:TonB-dependent receptor [Moraxella sp. Tifton1]MCL1623991.1 TonB-dependent receptor [Moraxella sp. Tifton1]